MYHGGEALAKTALARTKHYLGLEDQRAINYQTMDPKIHLMAHARADTSRAERSTATAMVASVGGTVSGAR